MQIDGVIKVGTVTQLRPCFSEVIVNRQLPKVNCPVHFSDIFNRRFTNHALNIEFVSEISHSQCYFSYYVTYYVILRYLLTDFGHVR